MAVQLVALVLNMDVPLATPEVPMGLARSMAVLPAELAHSMAALPVNRVIPAELALNMAVQMVANATSMAAKITEPAPNTAVLSYNSR